MSFSRRQKITAALLVLYWPAFFIAAHTPIPRVVREADVSDKSLHFVAYLILVFLLRFTVSNGGRVSWRRSGTWFVFFTMVGYAILDEWSQSFVAGRSCDVRDFVADLAGTCIGLFAFSFLSFWPAGFLVTAVIIFISGNVAQANLADLLPAANAVFHLISYACLTAFWLRCVHLFTPAINLRQARAKWLLTATAAPAALLLATKIFSTVVGKEWAVTDVAIATAAIAATVAVFYGVAVYDRGVRAANPADHSV